MRAVPEIVWTPLASGIIMLALGGISMAAGQPLLFPSLAPATVTHVARPRQASAHPYPTIVGQLLGIGCAYLAVRLIGATASPSVLAARSFPARRMWATALGIVLTAAAQEAADALNPPAAATVVLITLGAFAPIARDFWTLVGGVLVMALLGEAARRLRLAQLDLL